MKTPDVLMLATIKRQLSNSAQANHNLLAGSVQAASVGTPLPPACLAGGPSLKGFLCHRMCGLGARNPFSALLSLTLFFFNIAKHVGTEISIFNDSLCVRDIYLPTAKQIKF